MGHSLAEVTFVDSIVSGREQKRRFVVTLRGGRAVGEGRKACMSSNHQNWPFHIDQVSNGRNLVLHLLQLSKNNPSYLVKF